MKRKKGSFLIFMGLLLITAALSIVVWNIRENRTASRSAAEAVSRLAELIPEEPSGLPGQDAPVSGADIPDHILAPDMEMPAQPAGEHRYIGLLEFPTLDLTLPVIDQWSYAALKTAPCRYSGSVYKDDMVIAAHNYQSHFSRLSALSQGNEVIFTDMDGNRFVYEVAVKETLPPTAVEEMISGEWDLTLFTCTYDGRSRFTVRCERLEDLP